MDEQIKDAFFKVKKDIDNLRTEISEIKEVFKDFENKFNSKLLVELSRSPINNTQTVRQINKTIPDNTTDTSTVPQAIEGLSPQNLGSSIGNEGASTDRQTDRQTDNSTHIYHKNNNNHENSVEKDIYKVAEIIDSLDNIKREIRRKFKKLTTQEMTVFSTIYQLESEGPDKVDYKKIASKLNLSESSIRDYVQRMVDKGIPINKIKHNNKKIYLSISKELKKITSLSQIILLRGL